MNIVEVSYLSGFQWVKISANGICLAEKYGCKTVIAELGDVFTSQHHSRIQTVWHTAHDTLQRILAESLVSQRNVI